MAARVIVEVVLLLIITPYYINLTSADNNNTLLCGSHGNCLCPEDILTFICSVSDGAATIWKGSIFNCPANEIILRHGRFENGVDGTCNDGEIVAYSTEVSNNSYSSQLNVTVSPEMHNGTIECTQLSLAGESFVGICTLIIATGTKHSCKYNNYNICQYILESKLIFCRASK